jgi:hypothetical protein
MCVCVLPVKETVAHRFLTSPSLALYTMLLRHPKVFTTMKQADRHVFQCLIVWKIVPACLASIYRAYRALLCPKIASLVRIQPTLPSNIGIPRRGGNMMHFKKGMMVLDQDEQTSAQDELKRAQRHLVFLDDEQKQGKRTRRFVRGMMVMKSQKVGK